MTESPFHLLGDQSPLLEQPKGPLAAFGSLAVHALILVLIMVVPWTPRITTRLTGPRITLDAASATPLISPPANLTQKMQNQAKPAEQVNLASLLNKEQQTPPPVRKPGMTQPASPKKFEAPPVAAPPAPKPEIEAPKLDIGKQQTGDLLARNLPGMGNIEATPLPVQPPPQIQPEEKPKIAFEKPGGLQGPTSNSGTAQGRIPLPQRATVEDIAREVARGGGGGLVVGDLGEGSGGLGESLNNPSSAVKNASALELLSDTQGVDFKPYLIRILSSVRRNWFAVMPESARLGRKGKVLIQFAINKDGSVPKLVIASTSGAEALDRAAVAGISASNPFPPLPAEFKGNVVRLQFTFRYNVPR
jgi:TonB family protein